MPGSFNDPNYPHNNTLCLEGIDVSGNKNGNVIQVLKILQEKIKLIDFDDLSKANKENLLKFLNFINSFYRNQINKKSNIVFGSLEKNNKIELFSLLEKIILIIEDRKNELVFNNDNDYRNFIEKCSNFIENYDFKQDSSSVSKGVEKVSSNVLEILENCGM